MKLKVIFLLTSVFGTFNLSASDFDSQSQLEQSVPDNKKNPSQTAIQATPQGSTIFTKAFQGAAALIGKSRGTIFLDLYKNGTLEADLLTNSKLAEDRLRDAAEERCKYRDLQSPKNQSTIYNIFEAQKNLAIKAKKSFVLDSQRADEYNPLLGQALEAITLHHATVIQPQLNQKRNSEKAAADAAYEKEMEEVYLVFAAQTASNKRDLDKQAHKKITFDLQNEKHYETLKTYETLLESIRQAQAHTKK